MAKQPLRTGVFIIGLAIAAGACQREGAEEKPSGAAPVAPEKKEEITGPIRDITIIVVAADRTPLLNRQVEVSSVGVQRVSNDRVFWIGADAEHALPVYLDEQALSELRSSQQRLSQGDSVTVVGEVRKAPGVESLQREWNLSGGDAENVSRAQVYIQARRVLLGQPAGKPQEPQPGQTPPQPAQPGQTQQPG